MLPEMFTKIQSIVWRDYLEALLEGWHVIWSCCTTGKDAQDIDDFSIICWHYSNLNLLQIKNDMQKHGHLLNRFVGQIWDSAVDVDGIPDGVPRAITNNLSLQRNIRKYLLWVVHHILDWLEMHGCTLEGGELVSFSHWLVTENVLK